MNLVAGTPGAASAFDLPNGWPTIRREGECASVRAALVGDTAMCGVVITGDAGVGKTTLARSVTQSLPVRTLWVVGLESARAIPLGVFAQLVGQVRARDRVAALATARKTAISEGYSVIAVDDAHLLDKLSAILLHQLALDGSMRVIATMRTGQAAPDAITSLCKDGYLRRLHLMPFTKDRCIELVEQALGGRVDALTADLLWESSGGNALFVRHLLEDTLKAGTLRHLNGMWQLRGRAGITAELASMLDIQVETLPSAVLHALQLLTFGEPLGLETLSMLVGDAPIEDAETRGLIRVVREPHFIGARFSHPWLGEVIRRGLGVAATQRLRRELVSALKERPQTTAAERICLAHCMINCGQAPDAPLLVGAARDAIGLANIPLGESLARAAVSCGGGLEASELLARSLLCRGKACEAETVLSQFDPDRLSEPELVRWGTVSIATRHWWLGDSDGAGEVLTLLRARLTHLPLRLLVDGVASASRLFENELFEAVTLSERVLAARDAPPAAVQWAAFGGAFALALMGRADEVAAVAERARAVENKAEGLLGYGLAFGEVRALTLLGEYDAAAHQSACEMHVSSAEQYLAWGITNLLAGTVDLARGRFGHTVARMEDTVAVLTSDPAAPWGFPARLMLAQSYAVLGRLAPCGALIAELRSRLGGHVAVLGPQLRVAEAWLAAAQGRIGRGVDWALDAARLAEDCGQRAIEMLALHDAVRFGDQSCLQRLISVTGGIKGLLAAAIAAHARAVLDRDPAAILVAAQRFEAIGALLSAADAAAQAAAAFQAADDRIGAFQAGAAATRLAAECGGIRTPALAVAAPALPLTTREHEIASLVAAGLSNKEIAERLMVSVRTVEGHLYRANIKLDISDREQLATMIREAGERRP
jgi:DNA-binding NarL/FixJ family response regulator